MGASTVVISIVSVVAAWGCAGENAPPSRAEGYLAGAEGARIFYALEGSNDDTIVVVHGGPGAGMNDIRPDLGPLAEHHAVIYYDQRGGGRSELPTDTTKLASRYFVDDLEAVRVHFHIERLKLVAHSFGAIIVAEYARTHPERVAQMVFLGATGPEREEAARFYRSRPPVADTASARLQFEVLQSLLDGTAPDPVAACRQAEELGKRVAASTGEFVGWAGSSCDMPPAAVRYYYRYTARLGPAGFGDWDFSRSLEHVAAPMLVIDGERDTLGQAMERAWSSAVPNGRLLVIPGAGRAAHAERPEPVFAAIDQFLAGRWPAGAHPVQ